jgi:hypothetical protein
MKYVFRMRILQFYLIVKCTYLQLPRSMFAPSNQDPFFCTQANPEHDKPPAEFFKRIDKRQRRVAAERAGSYPVELPKKGEAADGEVGEGEVVDLLGGVFAGELRCHGLEERHVVQALEIALPHLRRSAAESPWSPAASAPPRCATI